jgi:arabinose-5-phosphate isomerase
MPKSKPSKDLKRAAGQSDALITSALRTLETEAAGINALAAAISDGLGESFIAAVDLMRQARGRVIVTGMGKSGHVGRKIAATLASTGTPAFFVHPSEASHGDLGMIAPDDVIIALSWSGETAELKDLTDYSASASSRLPLSRTRRSARPLTWCWHCRKRARPARTISRPPPPP